MCWIEGVARTPNGFVLETLNDNGNRTIETLAEMGTKPLRAKTSRNRILTDLRTWLPGAAEPFWIYLGIDALKPRDGHQVFKLEHEGTDYLIPASVAMAAMIRPIKHLHPYLFRPHGLEQISVPLLDAHRPSVDFVFPVQRIIGSIRMLSDGLLANHSWLHCFPSARMMWDSVYQAAQAGRVGMALPKASMSAVFHSVAWNGIHLVTDIVITTLHAEEAPFDFAASHSREIVFHESASIDWAQEHQPKEALPSRDGAWELSDDEWQALAPAIYKKQAIKHDLRRIIDLILFKLGTGTAWRKLDFQGLNFSIVLATYQRMQHDGRWETIQHTLKTTRARFVMPKRR